MSELLGHPLRIIFTTQGRATADSSVSQDVFVNPPDGRLGDCYGTQREYHVPDDVQGIYPDAPSLHRAGKGPMTAVMLHNVLIHLLSIVKHFRAKPTMVLPSQLLNERLK